MNKRKIGVLVSGRGSNLQALMDEIAAGTLNVEITVVISDKKDAVALERAAKAGIKTHPKKNLKIKLLPRWKTPVRNLLCWQVLCAF